MLNSDVSSVYVRSAPQAFTIGTLVQTEHFTYNTDDASGDYRWGRARGAANKCGWVNITYFHESGSLTSSCTSSSYSTAIGEGSRIFLRSLYACAVNDYVPPGGVFPFFINTDTGTYEVTLFATNVYGNYDTGTSTLRLPVINSLAAGAQFNWRWISDNSLVVLGKVPSPGGWGFIPRNALRGDLMYADSNSGNNWRRRWDSQAGG